MNRASSLYDDELLARARTHCEADGTGSLIARSIKTGGKGLTVPQHRQRSSPHKRSSHDLRGHRLCSPRQQRTRYAWCTSNAASTDPVTALVMPRATCADGTTVSNEAVSSASVHRPCTDGLSVLRVHSSPRRSDQRSVSTESVAMLVDSRLRNHCSASRAPVARTLTRPSALPSTTPSASARLAARAEAPTAA